MNESKLILEAIKKPTPKIQPKQPKQNPKSITDIFDDSVSDALSKLSKTKKIKHKTISEWEPIDFINHIRNLLKQSGLDFFKLEQRDFDKVNKLYDFFVECIGSKMDNTILKSYFEWWVSLFAKYETEITIYCFFNKHKLKQFLEQLCLEEKSSKKSVSMAEFHKSVDIKSVYKTAGLSLILSNEGIVNTYYYLVDRKEDNIDLKISKSLLKCSKNILKQIIDKTLENSPYAGKFVDVWSIVEPVLKNHGINGFSSSDFKNLFGGKVS